mmetsp:Transcript_54588/g.171408  ORF Transcript_54588/g.171408 Transcript_54588/m.171408 type:complete len:457 (-) Transcript_54588:91-1461(-)
MLRIEALLAGSPENGLQVEAGLLDPLVVHHLAHVIPGGVGEQHGHALVLADVVLLDEAGRARHRGAAAAADEQALVPDDGAHGREGLVVVRLHPVVRDLPVEHRGDEVVADALHLVGRQPLLAGARGAVVQAVGLREDAAVGVHGHDLHAGDLLLQLLRGAGDGAAGARGHDHVVQLPADLLHDLLGRAVVVRERVARVDVLVQHVAVELLRQPGRQEDVGVLGVPRGLRGRAQDLGAEALHGVHLLPRHLLRQADDHLVALEGGRQGEPDARVAAGGLDQHVPGLDPAALLRLLDHALADAVLDGAAGVEELHLGEQLALDVEELGEARHADHGREADQVEGGVADLRVGPAARLLARAELHEVLLDLPVPAVVGRRRDLALPGGVVGRLLHLPGPRHDRVHGGRERPRRRQGARSRPGKAAACTLGGRLHGGAWTARDSPARDHKTRAGAQQLA